MGTSYVGGQRLPAPAGELDAPFPDRVLASVADFLAWSLRHDLDAKLAQMRGTSATAVAQVYPFDPGSHFVRGAFPALYVWADQSKRLYFTQIRTLRVRRVKALWVFDEVMFPNGFDARAGLTGAVEASIAKAADRGLHESYGFAGAAPGTAVQISGGFLDWWLEETTVGKMAPVPAQAEAPGGTSGHSEYAYPCVQATLTVYENIDPDEQDAVAASMPDVEVRLGATDLALRDGVLVSPDGA